MSISKKINKVISRSKKINKVVSRSKKINKVVSRSKKINIFNSLHYILSKQIKLINKYDFHINYTKNKYIYSKQFTKLILNLQKKYYINDNYKNKEHYNETLKKWIKDTNTYKVGESFYTKKAPTISTPNYEDDYIFLTNKNDLIIQPFLKNKKIPYENYLMTAMSAYMAPNSIMLDIGTNIGTVAIPMSRANKGVVVIAFEPFRKNYILFLENIKRNNAYNIIPLPIAVGDKPQESVSLSSSILKINDNQKTKRVLIPKKNKNLKFNYGAIQLGIGGDKVKMISIDSLHLNFDIMKIDIEGAEPLAFYGAKESIKRCMPIIAFENNANSVTPEMRKSLNITDNIADFNILKYCYSLGYRELYEIPTDNFMLIPPNRKVVLDNPLWKYEQITQKFKKFKSTDLDGYRLYKYIMPLW